MTAPSPADLTRRYGFAVHEATALGGSDRAWRLETARGLLLLRLHGPDRDAAHAGEMAVLQRLEAAGYPAPRLIRDVHGSALSRWGERTGYLTTFVPGHTPEPGIETARRLGAATGRLHALGIDADLPATGFTVTAERLLFRQLDADPAARAWAGYEEIRADLCRAWEELPDLTDVPQVIVHTDVIFKNAVHTPAGDVVLIDWDDTGRGPAIDDVGFFLVHHTVHPDAGGELDLDVGRAFLAGYQQHRRLSKQEWQRLPAALLFGALAYVLAPWESRVYERIWRRARHVLDHGEQLLEALATTS